MSKSKDLSMAYGMQRRKKMAKGGPVSAKTEKRPMPDSKGQEEVVRNDHKKPASEGDSMKTAQPNKRQAAKGPKTTPIKHPTMAQSPVFKTKLRDQEDDLQESASVNNGPQEEPPTSDDEEGANRQGPHTSSLDMPMMAEGGEIDGSDEMEMEHHDSIAAAIMARRDRLHAQIDSGAHDLDEAVKMAEGGEVDIEMNGEEMPNDFDDMNEAALKENYDDDLEDVSQPMDSNRHGHKIESDRHDMIDSIRRKVSSKRQFKG